jgi:hypothetical protein
MREQQKGEAVPPKVRAVEATPPAEAFTHPATQRFFASLKVDAEGEGGGTDRPFSSDSHVESEQLERDIVEIEEARAALDRVPVQFVIDLGALRTGTS